MKKKRLSASQINQFKDCQRSWFLNYVDKVKKPSTPATAFGSSLHSIIEHYLAGKLIENADPKALKLFEKALETGIYDFEDGVELEIEKKFDIVVNDEYYMTGFVDLLIFPETGTPIIGDHKSIGNWMYSESNETLHKNLQLLIYAAWFFQTYPEYDEVILKHFQLYKPNGKESKTVECKVFRDYIEEFWEKIVKIADHFERVRNIDKSENVRTSDACGNYGGCFYYKSGHCSGHTPKVKQTKDLSKWTKKKQ